MRRLWYYHFNTEWETDMKKSILIMICCLIMLIPLTAFADNEGVTPSCTAETVNGETAVTLWGSDRYIYVCDLGEKEISAVSDFIPGDVYYDEETGEDIHTSVTGRKCFGLNAGKPGYYAVLFGGEAGVELHCEIHKKDGAQTEEIFKSTVSSLDEMNRENGVIFTMDRGEYDYAFVDEYGEGEYSLCFVFLGEELSSVSAEGPIVYGFDSYFSEDGKGTDMYPNLKLEFSSGRVMKTMLFSHSVSEAAVDRTVSAEVEISEKKYTFDVGFIAPETLIKDISMPEDFKPKCKISYESYIYDKAYPEYITVTTADGNEKRIRPNESIKLSNGKTYYLLVYYGDGGETWESGDVPFTAELCGLKKINITVNPECESAGTVLRKAAETAKWNFVFGIRILKDGTEDSDFTKQDAFYNMTVFPRLIIKGCGYYAGYGKYADAALLGIAGFSPVVIAAVLTAAVIIAIYKKHKFKESGKIK